MCNYVHKSKGYLFRKVKPTGTAWKVFTQYNDELIPMTNSAFGYTEPHTNGSIDLLKGDRLVWDDKERGDGFCGFVHKKDAEEVAPKFLDNHSAILKKIRYSNGLGSFTTNEVDGQRRRVIIFKEFELA